MVMSLPAVEVTDATFESAVIEESQHRAVVVDFWAGWCAPCRTLGPILEDAVARHGGVTLAKLDVDANPGTTARFGIQGIPAVKAFRDGDVALQFVGLQPRAQVERFLAMLAPAAPPPPLPADEASLRAAMLAAPDDPAPRRALGGLLLEAGRLDEADDVLAPARDDPVADGLRARIEIRRDGDEGLAELVRDAQGPEGLRRLIAAIRGTDGPVRSQLRRVVIGGLAAERQGDPEVEALRGELASALF
jgi:putative thioredoxin